MSLVITISFKILQKKGTPSLTNTTQGRKRAPKIDGPVPKKKAKKSRSPNQHEVEIQEEVEDAIEDDEFLPPTQLPLPTKAPRRETRSAATNKKKAVKRGVTERASKPPQASIILTQKRKDNISATFLASLTNKGISEELRKTKRY